ncbi:EAL and HDOD domain-containing protein [Denitratisoma sp. DHT3]|uniref:EAL and HDOD domain-containing protein n=1 Tax=Denitratisoma sp. DHT3 TaxID=1981880 RepID=UPI001644BAC0|nr:EAL domain-containing protein [Denitratisoma sp. DHT3]
MVFAPVSARQPPMDCTRYSFAYQPILNAAQASVAVELLYRRADGAEEPAMMADAVVSAFIHSGLDDLLRLRRAFVPASAALLASDLLNLLPADRFALEIDLATLHACAERCRILRTKGFRIVIDLSGGGASARDGLGDAATQADMVKFDAAAVAGGGIDDLVMEAWGQGAQLYARGVDQPEQFEALKRKGFHLFQGYHFARRTEIAGKRADPQKMAVLDLLSKLAGDKDDRVLEEAFKADPVLSVHLLRLVNSSAFALPTSIRSIKHAFSILGRKQLTRWLQVLLYVLHGEGHASPLMELALRRARFMEYVLTYRTHHVTTMLQEEAYMVGLLSLADVLMGWPMEKVAKRLNLADELCEALVERRAPLGHLILLCEALEQADFDEVNRIADELQLSQEQVMTAQAEALTWAQHICEGGAAREDSVPQQQQRQDQGQ